MLYVVTLQTKQGNEYISGIYTTPEAAEARAQELDTFSWPAYIDRDGMRCYVNAYEPNVAYRIGAETLVLHGLQEGVPRT